MPKLKAKTCKHPHLVPLEIHYARITHPNGPKELSYFDYSTNIMGANISRVKKYYCPTCDNEVDAPCRFYNEKKEAMNATNSNNKNKA